MTDADTRAEIFQNTLVKAATGLGFGLLLGRFVFRRTLPTVLFTTGFGLGMACAEAGPMLTAAHPATRITPHIKHCPMEQHPTVEIVINKAADVVKDQVVETVKAVKEGKEGKEGKEK